MNSDEKLILKIRSSTEALHLRDVALILSAFETAMEGLKVSCGDRCAKGLNPCAAQDALDQIQAICEKGESHE